MEYIALGLYHTVLHVVPFELQACSSNLWSTLPWAYTIPCLVCCMLYHLTWRRNDVGLQACSSTMAISSYYCTRMQQCTAVRNYCCNGIVAPKHKSLFWKRKVSSHYKVPELSSNRKVRVCTRNYLHSVDNMWAVMITVKVNVII